MSSTSPGTPDIEHALREWLRDAPLSPVVGRNIFFGIPDDVPAAAFLTLARVGGAPSPGTTPLDGARISFDVWGSTKKEAGDAARALVDRMTDTEAEDIGNGVHLYGASVDLMLWRPAADTGRPRYIVDVTTHARPIPQ